MVNIDDANWLPKAIEGAGITISELARRSGVSRSQIHRISLGRETTTGTLRAIRDVLEPLIAEKQSASVALCGLCEMRAEDPKVRSCTNRDCPLSKKAAA